MKRFFFALLTLTIVINISASELVLIPTKNYDQINQLFKNPSLRIHFYKDNFVIATLDGQRKEGVITLDQTPWGAGMSYYIVSFDESVDKGEYVDTVKQIADILFDDKDFMIIRVDESRHGQLPPAKNDGMVRIYNTLAKLPSSQFSVTKTQAKEDPFVQSLINEVNGSHITATVQHLQDYGTRNAYNSQSVLAQQWLATQFEELGIEVEVMDFTMPSGPASDNVIATQIGTLYPDQFVVVGGHYDSRSWSGSAPGADDNASGTAAVLEIARVLSEHEFDRSIIYCAFSGEEYGLYGSAAYAYRSAQQGMGILGYFNLDMIGYLEPGNTMMTTLIYPQSAQELATFYTTICSIYLPDFVVEPGNLTGGDSDHTSFNNNGFMGIFPFENINAYSPHIHTSNDIIGPSYNNEDQAVAFTKASLASVATLSNCKLPPRNLVAIPGDGMVTLQWDEMYNIDFYNIYRDGELLSTSLNNLYSDFEVENGTQYEYYITALYSDLGEESDPSNVVSVTPMPPISLPLLIDFENGATYWNFDSSWGLSTASSYSPTHSLTESPSGNYLNNQELYAYLNPINLVGFTDAILSFWTKYDIETSWDYMWLEISTNGHEWIELDVFTGIQSTWIQKDYSLQSFLGEPSVFIRFHFSSDYTITRDGMYIDDFSINVEGGVDNTRVNIPNGWSGISSFIDPINSDIEVVLNQITDKVIILKNLEGIFYPNQGTNTLGSWDVNSGYMVKSTQNVFLDFYGDIAENKTINLSIGWNLIPVLTCQPVDVEELFNAISGQIDIVKDIANAGVFWPSEDINTLINLLPGKAYHVKANSPVSISFPECESKHYAIVNQIDRSRVPWEMVLAKPNSHTISFPSEVIQNFETGDFIGAFTTDAVCVGYFQIDDKQDNYALVAYANDEFTDEIDGFTNGEGILLKYYNSINTKEYNLIVEYVSSMPDEGQFTNEGLSKVLSLTVDYTGISTVLPKFFEIFPNPAKDFITVQMTGNQIAKLEVINPMGQNIHTAIIEGISTVNTSNWAKGIYIFRVKGNERIESKIIVIQ